MKNSLFDRDFTGGGSKPAFPKAVVVEDYRGVPSFAKKIIEQLPEDLVSKDMNTVNTAVIIDHGSEYYGKYEN